MNTRTRKKRRELKLRRWDNQWNDWLARHRREIARGEGGGLRCHDCKDIPLFSWERLPHETHIARWGEDWPTGIPGDPGMDE